MSGYDSFKSDAYRESSPQPSFPGTSHKRSASGNPRPASRTTEERRTEKVHVTARETLVSRTKSPDRRGAPAQKDKAKNADGGKARPAPDLRTKEVKPEAPPQGMCHGRCLEID